jgi:hypothetical protein
MRINAIVEDEHIFSFSQREPAIYWSLERDFGFGPLKY